jgi:CIC family chloride channel protein
MTSYQSVSRFAGRFAAWRAWPSWARVAVLSSVVGVIAGILAALIFGGVHWVENKLLQQPLGIPEGLAGHFVLSPWGMGLILLIPGLGGLATGLIIKYACPEVSGGGTGEILRSYHHREAMMRGRVVPWKWLASCLTVGTGGAGGTEGPVAQMGSAAGSWLAQVLDLSPAERGLLFTAGIAGGIGAVFRAPLGGALFACEMYYSSPELEDEGMVPSLIASVSAYTVFGLLYGFKPLISGDSQLNLNWINFGALAAIALFCALGARAYVGWLDFCSKAFKKIALPWRPSAGGLLTGALALLLLLFTQRFFDSNALVLSVLSEGYPILSGAVLGGVLPMILVLVLVGKLLASGFTVSSGGSSGVFAPSMVIGGCIGALAALGLTNLGYAEGDPKAYVLAGMAAFFSAGTACPLASLIIITEVAQGYHLLPALMWVVAIGYLLRPRPGLFKDQVKGSADSPVHREELQSAFLRSRRVGQLLRRESGVALGGSMALTEDQDLGSALKSLKAAQAEELPVVNAQGEVLGVFGYHDIVSG